MAGQQYRQQQHRGSAHRLTASEVEALVDTGHELISHVCSTPNGIGGGSITFLATPVFWHARAQRLTASEVEAWIARARSRANEICAQRLTASEVEAYFLKKIQREHQHNVLNA